MAHNPRHKKRFGTLPTNRPTKHPVLSNRIQAPAVVNAPSMATENPAADLTILEQIQQLRRKTDEELAIRQLEQEQRELAAAARATKREASKKAYEDRIAELEVRKAEFFADEKRTLAARQAKRVETGGAAPSLEDVQSALQGYSDITPEPGAVHEDMPGITQPPDPRGDRVTIDEAANQPLYVTDDGEPIYLQDVIAVGGAARLRAISRAAKPIQEAFFRWIHKLKLARRLKGKPPADPARILPKAGAAAAATGAGVGTALWLGDEGLLPSLEHVGGGRVVPRIGSDEDTATDEQVEPTTQPPVVPPLAAPELDEVTEGPIISYAGPWAEGKAVDEAVVTRVAKEEKSTVRGSEDLPDETRAALERTWGKWTYNPRQRRDRYMEQLNSIYRKGAWLDALASLTGNPSRSGAYIQRAVAKMEAMQMFDQEERIYNIWRDVYFASDGTYDPPANKAEAARRARRLGASPQEVKKIYGWTEEEPDLQQWYRVVDGELETTQTKGKKVKPKGDGWIMGSPPATLQTGTAVTHVNWTDGDRTITLEKGQTPQGVGHAGDWYKGTAKDEGKVPGGKPAIDFIENVYLNSVTGGADEATAKAQAADARFLQYKQNPELYGFIAGVTDDMMRQSALAEIENIIASFEARGRKSYSSQGAVGGTGSVSLGVID